MTYINRIIVFGYNKFENDMSSINLKNVRRKIETKIRSYA